MDWIIVVIVLIYAFSYANGRRNYRRRKQEMRGQTQGKPASPKAKYRKPAHPAEKNNAPTTAASNVYHDKGAESRKEKMLRATQKPVRPVTATRVEPDPIQRSEIGATQSKMAVNRAGIRQGILWQQVLDQPKCKQHRRF